MFFGFINKKLLRVAKKIFESQKSHINRSFDLNTNKVAYTCLRLTFSLRLTFKFNHIIKCINSKTFYLLLIFYDVVITQSI